MSEKFIDRLFNNDRPTATPAAPVTPLAGAATPYAKAALAGEVANLQAVPIGQGRNHALNVAAVKLYRLAAAGQIDEHTVTETLGAADGGLDYPATRRTLQSAREAVYTRLGARVVPDRDEQTTTDPFGDVGTVHTLPGAALNATQPQHDDSDTDGRSSWLSVDLGPFLDGTRKTVEADLMQRSDGVCLLYPGLVHSFHGESESGKSLILQLLAVEQINAGERVLFVDFESDPASIVDRMRQLGADDQALREHFHYVQPETRPDASQTDRGAWNALLRTSYRLAIIDGVTDALSVYGFGTKENDDVTAWMRAMPKRIAAETGAAVCIIDHVTKDTEGRGRFAIGGQAKMAGLTGAAYTVTVVEPLGRGMRGTIALRIGKDRPGTVRKHCGPFRKSDRTQEAARIAVDATSDGPTTWSIEPWQAPGADKADREAFRPTTLMEKVSRYIEDNPDASRLNIRDRVPGRTVNVLTALDRLVDEGFVTVSDGARGAKLHTIARSYRQATDRQSDVFRAGTGQALEAVPEAS